MKSTFVAVFIILSNSLFAQQTDLNDYLLVDSDKGLKDIAFDDFNKDGLLDVVLSNNMTHTVTCYEQKSYGVFKSHVVSEVLEDVTFVSLSDLDGDGAKEIIFSDSNEMGYLKYSDGFKFSSIQHIDSVPDSWSMHSLDFDKDGDQDIVISSRRDNALYWIENDELYFERHLIADSLTSIRSVALMDANTDGQTDFICSSKDMQDVILLTHTDSGYVKQVVCENAHATLIQTADVDADGRDDFICGPYHAENIHIHYNNGDDSFRLQKLKRPSEQTLSNIELVDWNQDGLMDLFVNDCEGNSTHMFKQTSKMVFQHQLFASARDPHGLVFQDWEGDGDEDLFITTVFDGKFRLIENDLNVYWSFSKLYFSILQIPYLNVYLIVVTFVLMVVIFRRYLSLSVKLRWKDAEISQLKHKASSQELINLNQERIIRKLRSDKKGQSLSPKRWSVFLKEYKSINPVFCDKLKNYSLSNSEFRLAVFIQSGLSANEIAEILSVNVNTIYVQRQRLKDKLRLKSTNELEGVIKNMG